MTDREPLAWRNIGGVVRMLQELGYHNFTDLQHRYKSRGSRETAKKVLWSAYMLDRRWSFGTGLPFAIHDSDIDYDVDFMVSHNFRIYSRNSFRTKPETLIYELFQDKSLSSAYMKAMVTYCRIAAEVRDSALGMPSPNHAKDSARDLLDFKIGGWRHNLPSCLQFHSDMDFDPLQGTRGQYRLRLLLYLRANQMRIVIHRKSSLRVGNDAIDTSSINAMVEVAQDTIRVLAKLSQGSNIYHAQQKTFNHFLESALSALLLVTCRSRVLGERACAAEVQLALEVIERLSTSSSITKKLAEKLRCFTATVQELPQSQSVGSGAESKRPPTGGDVASIHPHAKDRMHVLYGETTEVSSHQNDASFEQLHHNGIGHNSLLSAIVNGQSLQTSLPGPSQTQQTMTCGLLSSGFNMVAQDFVPPLLYNFGSGHSEISPNSTTGDPTLVGTSDMAAVDLDVTTTEKWDGLLSELGDFWDDYDRMITF